MATTVLDRLKRIAEHYPDFDAGGNYPMVAIARLVTIASEREDAATQWLRLTRVANKIDSTKLDDALDFIEDMLGLERLKD